MSTLPLLGETACLAAAFLWAIALTLFRRPIAAHGPWVVNLAKSLIATAFFGATLWIGGAWPGLLQAPGRAVVLIALSGLVGLSLGDTAIFAAVHRLGVHRTLLLQTMGPIFTALLSMGFYGERLTLQQLAGAGVILVGVAVVVAPGRSADSTPLDVLGLGFAVLAALGQAGGIVLVKDGMTSVAPLAAAFVRIGSATVALVLFMAAAGLLRKFFPVLGSRSALVQLAGPALLGSYVAVFFMMIGIVLAPASIAATLLATTPIWSLFLDARQTGTRITPRSLGGTALAVAGVAMLTLA